MSADCSSNLMCLICLPSSSGVYLRTRFSMGMLPGVPQASCVSSGQLFQFLSSFWQSSVLEASQEYEKERFAGSADDQYSSSCPLGFWRAAMLPVSEMDASCLGQSTLLKSWVYVTEWASLQLSSRKKVVCCKVLPVSLISKMSKGIFCLMFLSVAKNNALSPAL